MSEAIFIFGRIQEVLMGISPYILGTVPAFLVFWWLNDERKNEKL